MSGKKVGILTLPIKNNYGGIIQLVALYHFLQTKGHSPIWIDKKHWHSPLKRNLIKLLEKNPLYQVYDPKDFAKIDSLHQQIRPFLKKYLPSQTQEIYNLTQLKKATQDIDTFVVGSDQIWRLEYVKDNYPTYFLDFVSQEKIKIAYAASFGKEYWEGDENSIQTVSKLLKNFDFVSVREDTAVSVCRETFDYDKAVQVLDPTFLPEVSFYENLINSIDFNKKTELFNYVLDANPFSDELVESISNQKKLAVHKIYLNNSSSESKTSLVENWLAHFYYADFVITDSFHGMVFSIIFNKQFLVIGNKERGLTRFTSLLKLLGLENRIITNKDDFQEKITDQKIDYNLINSKLDILKKYSQSILLENITNDCESE